MVLVVFGSTAVAQAFLKRAAYQLIEVDQVTKIANYEHEKYFLVKDFSIDRNECLDYFTAKKSGRRNQNLNYYLYLACPFEEGPAIWCGISSNTQINSSSSQAEKERAFQQFSSSSLGKLSRYNFFKIPYFERVPYSNDLDGYLTAIEREGKEARRGSDIILKPQTEPFKERFGKIAIWFFIFLLGGIALVTIILYRVKFNKRNYQKFEAGKKFGNNDFDFLSEYLSPLGKYRTTASLIWINVGVFVILVLNGVDFASPGGLDLLPYGALERNSIVNGQLWRLLTAIFLHFGVFHLVMNMFGFRTRRGVFGA